MTRDPGSNSWRIAEQVWQDDQDALAAALSDAPAPAPPADDVVEPPPAPDLDPPPAAAPPPPASAAAPPGAPPPPDAAPPVDEDAADRSPVTLEVLLQRVAGRVEDVCRQELAALSDTLEGLRDATESMAATLRRLDLRIEDLERRPVPSTLTLPVTETGEGDEGGELAVGDARQLVDALLAVAQHLEAVQTSTAWAIVRELRAG